MLMQKSNPKLSSMHFEIGKHRCFPVDEIRYASEGRLVRNLVSPMPFERFRETHCADFLQGAVRLMHGLRESRCVRIEINALRSPSKKSGFEQLRHLDQELRACDECSLFWVKAVFF